MELHGHHLLTQRLVRLRGDVPGAWTSSFWDETPVWLRLETMYPHATNQSVKYLFWGHFAEASKTAPVVPGPPW